MKKNIPVEKNKEYIVTIVSYGSDGEGIGKIDGFPIFINRAIKGEEVKVLCVKVKKNMAYGKIVEIIKSSEDRVTPICNIYDQCGGCNIQHLSYEAQLKLKKDRIIDCLSRLGKIPMDNIIVHDTIGMENPYRYRNKVQLPVGEGKNGEINIGFYANRSHNIVDMNTCYIQSEIADTLMKLVKQWMKRYNISAYNEETHSGIIRHIMLRSGFKTEEQMVVIVTNKNKVPYINELIEEIINNIKGVVSIVQNINTRNTNVILGTECVTLWGESHISDYIGEYKFIISPLSFFQINPIQTEKLYSKALEYADLQGDEVVFDAYCGTGTISLFLSEKAKKVYGVEIIPQAIENAKVNADRNKIHNAEFIVGKSEEVIPQMIEEGNFAEVVVVDPPRKGCEFKLLEAIGHMKPEKIVYVSCDPATLARDLKILMGFGYEILEVQPVDMFPQTSHVECVVLITRNDK
ncbi:23S rRNA (uracil(1939)-C(5))-methyltransferase RlmD [Clostridium grantii]|uniref:23S rRNA m(5)U-1939 methyltransferase n=1 Tax=Clostridium grantii DSM 8605 TaxID=1121316 RepID=A0A1M5U611_9CLOT|nr:23S rRNA (uracil(1939)-C(5))-methyltransferase RlmD [Clostridium grantii]SHH58447.1 23S rRNA m(5)U-1939 methyltransferase [Clostridium grantii DSM 8605]